MRRFTLVELMIVVAIIAVLAAIGVPLYAEMQLRAKKAELPMIVDGLVTSEQAYLADQGAFLHAGWWFPDNKPGKEARPWSGIPELGWAPDGDVRGSYGLNSSKQWTGSCDALSVAGGVGCPSNCLFVMAYADVDGDGKRSCGAQGTWGEPFSWSWWSTEDRY